MWKSDSASPVNKKRIPIPHPIFMFESIFMQSEEDYQKFEVQEDKN